MNTDELKSLVRAKLKLGGLYILAALSAGVGTGWEAYDNLVSGSMPWVWIFAGLTLLMLGMVVFLCVLLSLLWRSMLALEAEEEAVNAAELELLQELFEQEFEKQLQKYQNELRNR